MKSCELYENYKLVTVSILGQDWQDVTRTFDFSKKWEHDFGQESEVT